MDETLEYIKAASAGYRFDSETAGQPPRIALDEWFGDFEEYCKNRPPAISTGIKKLDDALRGGLRGNLYVIGAKSGYGKTALAVQIALEAARAGKYVYFFSFEISRYDVVARLMSLLTANFDEPERIKVGNVQDMDFTEDQKNGYKCACSEMESLSKYLIILDGSEDPEIPYTPLGIKEYMQQHLAKPLNEPVLIIDHLQNMPKDGKDTDSGLEALNGGVATLRDIARLYGIPVIALSCFAKNQTFKGSSNIESDAWVTGILRYASIVDDSKTTNELEDAKKRNPRAMELVLEKNRDGAADTIPLNYYCKYGFFD